MSDLFENIELQMQADAKEKNPRSAILASQMETEKRFGNFIDENINRVSIIEKEIKNVTDKFAHQYDVDPKMVYEATVSYLTKNAENFMPEEDEGLVIAPGIKDYLKVMKEAGFEELSNDWEQKLSSLDLQDQVDLYGEIVDSFVEAVESRPVTDMWDNDPNQYEEWDRTSSVHKDLSDEELLNKIKEHVNKLKKLDEPMGEDLEELHQELWDRSGHGDKWKNRNKTKEEGSGEEKTAAGNYTAYQIKGNDHFLCPHCAQEMTGEDLEWEDSLSPISNSEMSDIAKYTGHSGKCDQCGEPVVDDRREASVSEDTLLPLGQKLIAMAEQSGHNKLADRWIEDWMNPETSSEGAHEKIASAARQLWEVLKGDRRPEVREFYSNNKDELVNLMTEANIIAYEVNPQRVSQREASVAKFVGVEEHFIQKEAMQIYGFKWEDLPKIWGPRKNDTFADRYKRLINSPGYGKEPFRGGVDYAIPGAPGLGPNGEEAPGGTIPGGTWHDYIMRSNLYGQKAYPQRQKNEVEVGGDDANPPPPPPPPPNRPDLMTNVRSSFTPIEERLMEVYMKKGLNEKYASIIVQSVGEMAQLQMDAPGLPVADSECETVDPDKSIGGEEGNKYQNWDVADKQKDSDAEHQDFTDFGEPVREFVQPGGEAPYSENTKKKIDEGAESVDMNKKKVKQEDNAPKKSY